MKNRLLLAMALNMSLVATASAVKLSSSGLGEVMIVPYYTVQSGNETLISITNASPDVKAVKLRFREAQNGQRVQSLNLYLPPNDMWTGKIASAGEGARLISNDASCAVPAIPAGGLNFIAAAYANDGGDAGLGRTREGFVEILEMGVVTDQEVIDAVSFDQSTGKPVDCDLVTSYWSEGGLWRTDATVGMRALSGGLMAEANIINVNDGVEYSQTVTVLEEFNDSADSLHSGPFFASPSLNSAFPEMTTDPNDSWAKPEDAVSGLLMSESLFNTYTVNPAVSATSEWNITFPTKHFYTDLDGDKKPFTSAFGADGACETVGVNHWNRETASDTGSLELCYVANVVRLIGTTGESDIFGATWGGVDLKLGGADFANGWVEVDFVTLDENATTPPTVSDYIDHIMESGGGSIYAGLPAIGFSASRLGNKNVGVGAAYAATSAHRYVRSVAHGQTDPACSGTDSVCRYFELDTDVSGNYDAHILPLHRNVYHFRSPIQADMARENRLFRFTVVDHGAEVSINLGLSKVKGRTQPGPGESAACFTGPGTELSLTMATDTSFTKCVMEFDTDYYFTIESLDADINGGYRLEFKEADY